MIEHMKIKEKLILIKNIILDTLFPYKFKCIFCGRDIISDFICKDCLRQDIFNEGNRCQICDTQIKEDNLVCDHCKKSKRHFKKAYAPFRYDGVVRKAILQFKSDGAKYLAIGFASFIAQRLEIDQVDFDVIIPVPSHKSAKKKRGYNPAKVIADELGKLTSKPIEDVLYKVLQTKNQKFLDYNERQTNLENSIMLLNNSIIKDKNILFVDDIITTGATIETCAKLCHKAKNIYACAIARRT